MASNVLVDLVSTGLFAKFPTLEMQLMGSIPGCGLVLES